MLNLNPYQFDTGDGFFACYLLSNFSTENTDNYYSVILLIQEQTVCLKVGKLFATCAS